MERVYGAVRSKTRKVLRAMQKKGKIISYKTNPLNERNRFSSFKIEILQGQFIDLKVFESRCFLTSCKLAEDHAREFSLLVGSKCPPKLIGRFIANQIRGTTIGLREENSFYNTVCEGIDTGNTLILGIEKASKGDDMNEAIDFWIQHSECLIPVPLQLKSRLEDLRNHKKSHPDVPGIIYRERLHKGVMDKILKMMEKICLAYARGRVLHSYYKNGQIFQL